MQAACFEYFVQGGTANLLIAKNDKDTPFLHDVLAYAGKKPYVLPDFRATRGEDLRTYSAELYNLLSALNSYVNDKSPKKILVSPIRTLLHPLPNSVLLGQYIVDFGERIVMRDFQEKLLHWGYVFVDLVETKGEVSFRGDVVDIFIPNSEHPIRISFFDDEVESLRYFACETQKSFPDELESIKLIPALFGLGEKEYEELNEKVQILESDAFVKDMLSLGFWGLDKNLGVNYLETHNPIFAYSMEGEIEEISLFEKSLNKENLLKIPTLPTPKEFLDVETTSVKEFLEFHKHKQIEILTASEALLKQAGIEDLPASTKIVKSSLIVNITGSKKLILSLNKPIKKRRKRRPSIILDELKVGDYVVHETYGIGIFKGLTTTTVLGATRDFVTIVYQGDDKLLLPVEHLEIIDRYISDSGGVAILDKLGKGSFGRLKEKTKIKLFEIAKEIVDIAAQRELIEGFAIKIPHEELDIFKANAGFEYTNDQEKAIEEIFADLKSGKVMDRLLSGDVGFGKTEVAMNAIVAVAKSGFQVAFVVPTTLLCSQHHKSLDARLSSCGIRVARLDRFTSVKEKKQILKDLEEKKVDVCIGTHALLGIPIKDLALLIIDEEHKFGVKQKEKLKNMRSNIHVLSMSATPIPRSLNMALSSIKQYSIISTPPKDREDVRTFVKAYDEALIKEVITREIRRNGQIFYIHNRIASIESKAKELLEILPKLRILILHSHISSIVLEKEMLRFEAGEYDLLLSTSIVESGIHLPNVNTMIIEAADRFGMADLHQLRGRVGRGARQGFCYFLVEDKEALTEQAKKRLVALESNSFLGSGSVLAYHDLEIRGGGNLIGEAQSGHIKNIGYSLYLKMLEDAINLLMSRQTAQKTDMELKLSISAYITPEYIAQDRVRLELYRRLSKCESPLQVYEIEEEMEDRFGKIDTPTAQFLQLIIIKILAADAAISSISNYQQSITITYINGEKDILKSPSKDDDDILATVLKVLRTKEKK
ncbi:MAG: transcription-repair coupling factor [Campylobacteraceae bacterium]|nr:transcription-repair coupling factor [Campylobacteraceae bacterium]